MQVIFGRKRPDPVKHARLLKFGDYVKLASLPIPPPECDYTPKALGPLSNVYDNDALGDCVIAGYYHVKAVATGNASGSPFLASDEQIVADYGAIGGYVPGKPETDQGCDEVTAIDYWRDHGDAAGTHILGAVLLDPTNVSLLQLALWLSENLYFGVELPDGWVNPMPSDSGFTWDVSGDPNPAQGHCFISAGYDRAGVKIDTWGMLGTLTYAACAKYAAGGVGGAVYSLITPDVLAKGATLAPNGVDWVALQADLSKLGAAVS